MLVAKRMAAARLYLTFMLSEKPESALFSSNPRSSRTDSGSRISSHDANSHLLLQASLRFTQRAIQKAWGTLKPKTLALYSIHLLPESGIPDLDLDPDPEGSKPRGMNMGGNGKEIFHVFCSGS